MHSSPKVFHHARNNPKNIFLEQVIKRYNYDFLNIMVEGFTKSDYTGNIRLQNIMNEMPMWIFRNHCLQLEAFKIHKKSQKKTL